MVASSAQHFYFLEKEIKEPTLLCVCRIAPQLDHVLKCSGFFRDKAV